MMVTQSNSQGNSPVSLPSFDASLPSTGSQTSVCPTTLSPQGVPPLCSTSHIRNRKVSRKKRKNLSAQGESYRRASTIGTLPDNILLEIFDFYGRGEQFQYRRTFQWHILAHVCRRWRYVVFASPHRLNLRIVCSDRTPVKKYLDIWPAFPIVVDTTCRTPNDEDNLIAALEHPDRVCHLFLSIHNSKLEKVATVMQEPFPVLAYLDIWVNGPAEVFPRFLGGSAPSLQTIRLTGIPIPTLLTLLLSASHLVTLFLSRIPPTGYISPEAMVVGLAALPRLNFFTLHFQSVTSRPDLIRPPPATRTVLPALIQFEFTGANEYLEALLSQIDAPQLDQIRIHYFNQLVDFQADQLSLFIARSASPETNLIKLARVTFYDDLVAFAPYANVKTPYPCRHEVSIRCEEIDWQVSHMAQVLSQFSVILSSVDHLQIEPSRNLKEASTDDVEWLHLLRQFDAVRSLHIPGKSKFSGDVARALEGVAGGMAAEVLPLLEFIWIEGRRLKKFDSARRRSGRPVTVCTKKKEFEKRLESYIGQ